MGWLQRIRTGLASHLVRSTVIHARQNNAPSTGDLVGVMDRFLDDALAYDLEWDDFISWESENAHVEAVRKRLGLLEPKLFSSALGERDIYARAVLDERERLAALIGYPARNRPPEWPSGAADSATPHPTR